MDKDPSWSVPMLGVEAWVVVTPEARKTAEKDKEEEDKPAAEKGKEP